MSEQTQEPEVVHVTIGMKFYGPGHKYRTDVPAPKLVLAKSYVEKCGCCHRWLGRWPQMYGDEGSCCDYCGCTSSTIRHGRPYGPKSKEWAGIVERWEDEWPLMADDIIDYWPDTVVTEPSLADLRDTVKRDVYGDDPANWQ